MSDFWNQDFFWGFLTGYAACKILWALRSQKSQPPTPEDGK